MSFLYILLLAVPVIFAIIVKKKYHETITWTEFGCHIVVALLASILLWNMSLYVATYDEKINNGYIIEKIKDKSSHIESRSCGKNCTRAVVIYTTEWFLKTTVGRIDIQSSRSESVPTAWFLPDPKEYTRAQKGDYSAKAQHFTNVLRNAPDSIFHTAVLTTDKVPEYPDVYSKYLFDHVVLDFSGGNAIDTPADTIQQLSTDLKTIQKTLEADVYKKDINLIVYLTDKPRIIRYSVERAWRYGKRNDVVIYVSIDRETEEVKWIDVGTWMNSLGNELYTVKLRDSLEEYKSLEELRTGLQSTLTVTSTEFKEFDDTKIQYLVDAAEPPVWLTLMIFCIMLLFNCWLTRFFHINDFNRIYHPRDIRWI